jgi:flagellar assembly factor FliW
MKIESTRFGILDVDDDVIIQMTKPVLGFEEYRRYVLVETQDFEPFKWFQSVDEPDLAFVVINPLIFYPDYMIEVNPKEIEELDVEDVADIVTYAIVTIPSDYRKMTANLQGPILINSRTRLAKQLVMVNSRHSIRQPLFDATESETVGTEKAGPVPVHV